MKPQIISIQIRPEHINAVKDGSLTKRIGAFSRAKPGFVVRFKFEDGDKDVQIAAVIHVAIGDEAAIAYNPSTGEASTLLRTQLDNMASKVGFENYDTLKNAFPVPRMLSIISWGEKFAYGEGAILFQN
jgi:hypothetical protein